MVLGCFTVDRSWFLKLCIASCFSGCMARKEPVNPRSSFSVKDSASAVQNEDCDPNTLEKSVRLAEESDDSSEDSGGQEGSPSQLDSGCVPTTGDPSGSDGDVELEDQPYYALKYMEEELKERNRLDHERLSLFDAISNQLCQNLLNKRSQCPAAMAIVDNESDEVSCFYDTESRQDFEDSCAESEFESLTEQKVSVGVCSIAHKAAKVLVNLKAPSGSYVLKANGHVYVTHPFEPGSDQVVEFKPPASVDGERPPIWLDILSLRLARKDSTAISDYRNARISVSFGKGQSDDYHRIVFDAQLSEDDKVRNEYTFGFDSSDLRGLDSACQTSAEDIKKIKAQIRKSFNSVSAVQSARDFYQQNEELDPQRLAELDTSENKQKSRSAIKGYEEKIDQRKALIAEKSDLIHKIEGALTENSSIGCQASQRIETLEVLATGVGPQIKGRGQSLVKRFPNDEQSDAHLDKYLIDLGLGTPQSVTMTALKAGFTWPEEFSDTVSIGNFSRIKIDKEGILYNNLQFDCREGTDFGSNFLKFFNNPQCYKVTEVDVFTLKGIQVRINGKLAYDHSNLDTEFGSENQSWYAHPRSNDAWRKLMRDTDCDVD